MAIDDRADVQDVDVAKLQMKLASDPLLNNKTVEIIIDNEDQDHIVINGDWKKEKAGYGKSILISQPSNQHKSVKFIPEIKKDGRYTLYAYISENEGKASNSFSFMVSDGKTNKQVTIKPSDIKVLGTNNESNGEWASLGTYELKAGRSAFVEVLENSNKEPALADAILFKPLD